MIVGAVIGYSVTDQYLQQSDSEPSKVERTYEAPRPPIQKPVAPAPVQTWPIHPPAQRANQFPLISVQRLQHIYEIGQPIMLSVSGYDPDGRIVSWELQCGLGGPSAYRATAQELQQCYCIAHTPGLLTIFVRATDNDGAVSEASVQVKVVPKISTMSETEMLEALLYLQSQEDLGETDRTVITVMLVVVLAAIFIMRTFTP